MFDNISVQIGQEHAGKYLSASDLLTPAGQKR